MYKVKKNYLHFPIEHIDTGSPTTATKDWALVIAVFKSLALDRKPWSKSISDFDLDSQVCLVLTALKNITRNCFPIQNKLISIRITKKQDEKTYNKYFIKIIVIYILYPYIQGNEK